MENLKLRHELTKKDVAWAIFDNFDGSYTMHHLLYNVERKEGWTGTPYISNAFICNKKCRVLDENENASPIETCEALTHLRENMACKKCLKFYNILPE